MCIRDSIYRDPTRWFPDFKARDAHLAAAAAAKHKAAAIAASARQAQIDAETAAYRSTHGDAGSIPTKGKSEAQLAWEETHLKQRKVG